MLKFVLPLLFLAYFASAQTRCPYPFTNSYNGYTFNYCYYYAGKTDSYVKAVDICQKQFSYLVMPKTDAALEDLYKLYKAYPNYYFWVGAAASPANAKTFYFQDGNLVYPYHFCKDHPKGGNNLCAFYTTTAVVGRDTCIQSGECKASFFDHGVICQA